MYAADRWTPATARAIMLEFRNDLLTDFEWRKNMIELMHDMFLMPEFAEQVHRE